jgi:hypothetical protein
MGWGIQNPGNPKKTKKSKQTLACTAFQLENRIKKKQNRRSAVLDSLAGAQFPLFKNHSKQLEIGLLSCAHFLLTIFNISKKIITRLT